MKNRVGEKGTKEKFKEKMGTDGTHQQTDKKYI
jgi:hypothetical protein